MQDLATWLRTLPVQNQNHAGVLAALQTEEVTLKVMPEVIDADLERVGIKLGPQPPRRLLMISKAGHLKLETAPQHDRTCQWACSSLYLILSVTLCCSHLHGADQPQAGRCRTSVGGRCGAEPWSDARARGPPPLRLTTSSTSSRLRRSDSGCQWGPSEQREWTAGYCQATDVARSIRRPSEPCARPGVPVALRLRLPLPLAATGSLNGPESAPPPGPVPSDAD